MCILVIYCITFDKDFRCISGKQRTYNAITHLSLGIADKYYKESSLRLKFDTKFLLLIFNKKYI